MPKSLVYFFSICNGLAFASLPHAIVFHVVLIFAQIFAFIPFLPPNFKVRYLNTKFVNRLTIG